MSATFLAQHGFVNWVLSFLVARRRALLNFSIKRLTGHFACTWSATMVRGDPEKKNSWLDALFLLMIAISVVGLIYVLISK
jgi:hypothetical protein